MFKKDSFDSSSDKVNTVIGKETVFTGTINGKGLIRIDGQADGKIINKGDVIIGESGKVKVDIKARNITIAGYYEGTIEAEGKLELKRTATAIGSFRVNGLLVESGSVLSGNLDMKHKDQSSGVSSVQHNWQSKKQEENDQ
ncbi:MAG: polymer-forming cytoskeletal protein [Bacillota bacterium]|nr:polymer-forming cytoskeletal protein [Bacillota bacterium]